MEMDRITKRKNWGYFWGKFCLKKNFLAELEHQCIHSFGHKLVKNPKLAFTNHSNSRQIMLGEMDNNVLCAEGWVKKI